MRRFLVTVTLFAASAVAAAAQTAGATEAAAPTLCAYYSVQDTIRAVRHLFGQRIKGGIGYVEAGSTVLAQAAVATALRPADASQGQRTDTNQDWLMGGLMTGYGLFRIQRFGPQAYQQIVAAYEQGEPLPAYVRRRLKTKYFRYVMR